MVDLIKKDFVRFEAIATEMLRFSGFVDCFCLLNPPVREKKHDEQYTRQHLTQICRKLPRLILVVLGALLCLTVQADTAPNTSINPPVNSRRELLVSPSISFGYTGDTQTW